jgi:multiple RNA-binding domain-containing protein 1
MPYWADPAAPAKPDPKTAKTAKTAAVLEKAVADEFVPWDDDGGDSDEEYDTFDPKAANQFNIESDHDDDDTLQNFADDEDDEDDDQLQDNLEDSKEHDDDTNTNDDDDDDDNDEAEHQVDDDDEDDDDDDDAIDLDDFKLGKTAADKKKKKKQAQEQTDDSELPTNAKRKKQQHTGEAEVDNDNHDLDADVDQHARLYVRNLSYSATEDELTELFSKYGQVSEVHLPIDSASKQPKGFAFVTFKDPKAAIVALNQLNMTSFLGRLMHVIPAKADENVQARSDTSASGARSYKDKKKLAQQSDSENQINWNALFVRVCRTNTMMMICHAWY